MLPCSEVMCENLEGHYRRILEANSWGDQFSLPDEDAPSGECACIFHNPKVSISNSKWSFYKTVAHWPFNSSRLDSFKVYFGACNFHPRRFVFLFKRLFSN